MCVLCNTNEEVFIAGSALQVISRKLFGSAAGMFCRGFALVHKGAPWGVCLSLFVFVRGFFCGKHTLHHFDID